MHNRLGLTTIVLAAVAFSGSTETMNAQNQTSPLRSAIDLEQTWSVKPVLRAPSDSRVVTSDGRTLLKATARLIVLESQAPLGPGTEVVLRFRLQPPDGKTASVLLQTGLQSLDDRESTGPSLSLSARATQPDQLRWALAGATRDQRVSGVYAFKGVAEPSLAWPEDLRRTVERDMASLPDLEQRWFRLRLTLTASSLQVYLDDRLLGERQTEKGTHPGHVRVRLSPGTSLATATVRDLARDDVTFLSVPIAGYVNASAIDGRRIAHDRLPARDGRVVIDGVPFLLPAPDAEQRDHIDLEPSWLQVGHLDGGFRSDRGGVGGRWAGALNVNPARLQLRVPNARYAKLHLLAAADSAPDSVPVVTAQFYRPLAGFPVSVESSRVPSLSEPGADTAHLPVQLEDGARCALHLVTLILDEGALSSFADLDHLELELTKRVRLYRTYPDPCYYSTHAAGLPSSVHVYAVTLERPAVDLGFEPDRFAHIWTEPDNPSYTVTLRNRTDAERKVMLELTTLSHDRQARAHQARTVRLPPAPEETRVSFVLEPTAYGYHDVALTMHDGTDIWTEKRSLAYLRADTRERGNWEEGKGILFGMWYWHGGHRTPSGPDVWKVMLAAGTEGICPRTLAPEDLAEDERKLAQDAGMICHRLIRDQEARTTNFNPRKVDVAFDASKPKEMAAALMRSLKASEIKPDRLNRPEYVRFFGEPHVSKATSGNLPCYWGDPQYEMDAEEQANFDTYLAKFLIGAPAVKKEWPHAKVLLPHGNPLFCVPFLRHSPEARRYIDGVGVDIGMFERLPEQQLHQCCLHRLWEFRQEWRKVKTVDPVLVAVEGPCLAPALPGALTHEQLADHIVRSSLIIAGYGVTRQLCLTSPFHSNDWYGEQHYGGGVCNRIPLLNPTKGYAAAATLTRQLNRMNFEKWIPTGSLSVYCLQFKHYKSGELRHVLWTIRGSRTLSLRAPAGARLTVYDQMDNASSPKPRDERVSFTVTPAPCYVHGLPDSPDITLGEPDHSDAQPAQQRALLANLGNGTWQVSPETDEDYATSHVDHVRRFPGRMSAERVAAPAGQGGKALAVRLLKQDKERFIMPYYTSLVPAEPIAIPGKASHLGLWVRAASDWGRVVYCLRDAAGERWISVGAKGKWNCDDMHGWSVFCFDGWRYLRFELPAHSPYDRFREAGTSWWGHYGKGDGIVHLPLRLEKVIVERRSHAMYVNDPQPTGGRDVLLSELYAEYETEADMSERMVQLAQRRMPVPENVPDLPNPMAEFATSGVGRAPKVTAVTPPLHQYDGTRCHVHFDPVQGATAYDVWVSPYPDGRGALRLGSDWTQPGEMIRGLRPDTTFYAFVVCKDADGRCSKPSTPLKFQLEDLFAEK